MPRTPTADTSNSDIRNHERLKDTSDNRARQLNPDKKNELQGGQAQQQSTHERDFAPGEDGECH